MRAHMQVTRKAPAHPRRAFFTTLLSVAAIVTIAASVRTADAGFPAGPKTNAIPNTQYPIRAGSQPLENGPAVKPAPPYTSPPSAHVTNDPHWRSPNVRANTDATTFAQQEPSIAVNPLNHLNVV